MTYKLLGKGSYGCVITPPINNNIVKVYEVYANKKQSDVGKLFFYDNILDAKRAFLEELKTARLINKIDGKSDFSVKLKGANTITINSDSKIPYELQDCLNIIPNRGDTVGKFFFQIIYENGGDILMEKYNLTYPTFIKFFKKLLLGLDKLHNNNIVHFDIKVDNIVMNDKKMRFIDFGVALKLKDIYSDYGIIRDFKNGDIYYIYPLELYIASYLYPYKDDIVKYRKCIKDEIPAFIKKYLLKIYDKHDHSIALHQLNIFLDEIKDLPYNKVFNADLARKIDIFSLHQMLRFIDRNTLIYENSEQKLLIKELIYFTCNANPYERKSTKELLELISKPNYNDMKGGNISTTPNYKVYNNIKK
jgi:serine/threonine protein kinase